MHKIPSEMLNDLKTYDLRKLGNVKKIPEMLAIDGKVLSQPPTNFDSCATNCQKSAVKHAIAKPILLNFVDLSTIFFPRLQSEHEH